MSSERGTTRSRGAASRRAKTPHAPAKRRRATFYRFDCRHFRGDKPCGVAERCEGCESYAPVTQRILIIKLAARGDVLRTTPLARALKARDPACHLTWVVDAPSLDLLRKNPFIDRLLPFSWEALLPLFVERFDLLLSLDKEPNATALATRVRAARKRGFGLGPEGAPRPLSRSSQRAYDLGIDDHLKFAVNTQSYQEIIFDVAELRYRGERYVFAPAGAETRVAERALRDAGLGPNERAIGLNTGGGRAFAQKGWTIAGFARLAERIESEMGCRVALLGGEDEREKNEVIARSTRARVLRPPLLPVREFAALLGQLEAVVTGDTLGLHLAIALGRPLVALFGSTTAREIDFYGLGEAVLPRVPCAPCYLRDCPMTVTCMDSIDVEDVMRSLHKVVPASRASGSP